MAYRYQTAKNSAIQQKMGKTAQQEAEKKYRAFNEKFFLSLLYVLYTYIKYT
jgi:hypothetical protein